MHLRDAIDLLVPLSDDYARSVFPPYRLGAWYHDLAELLTVTGRLEEAEKARKQSLAAWQSAGTPVPLGFPHGKALAHYRLGELLHAAGRTEEARHEFDQVLAIMEELASPPRGIGLPLATHLSVGQLPRCGAARPSGAPSRRPSTSCRSRLDIIGAIRRWPSTETSSGKRRPTQSSRR